MTLEASKHLVHEDHLVRTEITTWDSDAGPFDVLRNIPDGDGERHGYEQLTGRSSEVSHAGVAVRIDSLGDIIASKQWAGRPKDDEALPELHAIHRRDDEGRGGGG